jgi:surface antigen
MLKNYFQGKKMARLVAAPILAGMLVFSPATIAPLTNTAYAAEAAKLTETVNGKTIAAAPIMMNNITMVPLRATAEALGWTVKADPNGTAIYCQRTEANGILYMTTYLIKKSMISRVIDKDFDTYLDDKTPQAKGFLENVHGTWYVSLGAVNSYLYTTASWDAAAGHVTITSGTLPDATAAKAIQSATNGSEASTDKLSTEAQAPSKNASTASSTASGVGLLTSAPAVGSIPAHIMKPGATKMDWTTWGDDEEENLTAPYCQGIVGQCTWYCEGRWDEVYGWKLPDAKWGNGGNWVNDAEAMGTQASGIKVLLNSQDVQPGAIACFGSGHGKGHVVFVEWVDYDSDGSPAYVYYTDANGIADPVHNAYTPGSDGQVIKQPFNVFIHGAGGDCGELNGYLVPAK